MTTTSPLGSELLVDEEEDDDWLESPVAAVGSCSKTLVKTKAIQTSVADRAVQCSISRCINIAGLLRLTAILSVVEKHPSRDALGRERLPLVSR